MKQETIKYFCDCCNKEILDNNVNRLNVEVKPRGWHYNPEGMSYNPFELCDDCMKKTKLLDSEKVKEHFIQMLKRM